MPLGRECSDLNELVVKWKRLLRLDAWDVVARYRRIYDTDGGRQGEINLSTKRREAFLWVLDPNDYDPACIYPQDIERTVCHELLHLLLDPIDQKDDKTDLEQIMHVLDGLLANGYREAPR